MATTKKTLDIPAPRPWRVDCDTNNNPRFPRIRDANGLNIIVSNDDTGRIKFADAALIVEAVNAYKRRISEKMNETIVDEAEAAKDARNRVAVRLGVEYAERCRECKAKSGNAAALREAMEKIVRIAEEWDTPGIHAVQATLYRILEAARAALAAPPRNCDRFPTLAAATDAWRMENRTWQWDDDNTAANYMMARASQDVGEFLDWLFAPAREARDA